MAVKKVIINGQTKMDLTDTTATEADVLKGKYFYANNGKKVQGTLIPQTLDNGGIVPASTDWWEMEEYWGGDTCEVIIPEGVRHLNRYAILQNGIGGIYKVYFPSTLETIRCGWNGPFAGASGNYAWFQVYTDNLNLYFEQTLKHYDQTGDDYYNGGYLYAPAFFTSSGEPILDYIIPEGIRNIPNAFFPYALSYEDEIYDSVNLHLPSTIEHIDGNFEYSESFSVHTVQIDATTPPYLNNSFNSTYLSHRTEFTLIVPKGTIESYRNATTWCEMADYMIEKDQPVSWQINNNTFTCPYNITWEDYINSSYNNGNYTMDTMDGIVYYQGEPLSQYDSYREDWDIVVPWTYIKNCTYQVG